MDGSKKKMAKFEPLNLSSLPEVIIFKIFSYLSTHDLLQNVSLISRQFYGYTKDPYCHRCVSITNCAEENGAVTFLQHSVYLRELSITRANYRFNGDRNCDLFLYVAADHKHLQTLCMDSTCFITRDFQYFIDYLTSLKKLVVTYKHDPKLLDFSELTESNFLLEHLEINSPSHLDPESVLDLVTNHFKNLKVLKLNWKPSDDDLATFILEAGDRIEELAFRGDFLTDRGLQHLSGFKNLRHLELKCSINLDQLGLQALAQLHHLHTLYLNSFNLTPDIIVRAFQPPNFERLRKLDITLAELDDNCSMAIAQTCPDLQYLEIYSTTDDLTSTGIGHIFRWCHKLQTFKLKSFSDRDVNLDHVLSNIWQQAPDLQLLDLQGRKLKASSSVIKRSVRYSSNMSVYFDRKLFIKSTLPIGEVFQFYLREKGSVVFENVKLCEIRVC